MRQIKRVSIVIPVYNEKGTILKLLKRVKEASTLGLEKEIVVVDDGSSDGSAELLKKLRLPGLKKVFLRENQGKGHALRQGFAACSGEIVIVQDADLEYHPDDYPLLIAPFLAQGARVVYGSRELKINDHSYPLYFLGGQAITKFTRLLYGGRLTDVPTGYKAFDRRLLMSLPLKSKRFEFCPEVTAHLLKRKVVITEVPIRYKPRTIEEGKKIKLRDGIDALWTLLRVRVGL